MFAVSWWPILKMALWLRLAERSTILGKALGETVPRHLSVPVESNQVFINRGAAPLAKLRAAGAEFYEWGAEASGEARLVVSGTRAKRT